MKEVTILFIDDKPVVYENHEDAKNDYKEFKKKHNVKILEHITMFTADKEYLQERRN